MSDIPLLRLLNFLLKFLRAYAIAVLTAYIWVPVMDIYWGVLNLFCHQKYEVNEEEVEYHQSMPAHKVYEQLGEAIPQFVIAVAFYANNAHWLPLENLVFGIFAIVISAGSIVMGLGCGCKRCYEHPTSIPLPGMFAPGGSSTSL